MDGLIELKPGKSGAPTPIIELPAEVKQRLEEVVDRYVQQLAERSPDRGYGEVVSQIANLAQDDVRAASQVSNRILDKPVRTAKGSPIEQTQNALIELRRTLEDLEPTDERLLGTGKLWGLIPIPLRGRVQDYVHRFQSSQQNINAIVGSLRKGAEQLGADNESLDQERENLHQVTERLRQAFYLTSKLDERLEAVAKELEKTDPAKAKALRTEVQFYVKQKAQDLLTQIAVNTQGYAALDLIRKTNHDLVLSVERASTTTVAALRTAVIAAQALAHRNMVLKQVSSLSKTTGQLIGGTGDMLKQQAHAIADQAGRPVVEVEVIRGAFRNIMDAMDVIDSYRERSLGELDQQVRVLAEEVEKTRAVLEARREAAALPVAVVETKPALPPSLEEQLGQEPADIAEAVSEPAPKPRRTRRSA